MERWMGSAPRAGSPMSEGNPYADGDTSTTGSSLSSAAEWNDQFSANSIDYRRYRFAYPGAFYRALAERAPATKRVWDCGAGSGQASVALAQEFEQVVASEASAEQLAHAMPHDRIDYRAERVERCSLDDASVDAVLAAQSAHWFQLDRFYAEVRRVVRPGGLIVLSTYAYPRVDPRSERIIQAFVEGLESWWAPNASHPFSRYESLEFPFEPVEFPTFECRMIWSLTDLLKFLMTWSGVSRAVTANGSGIIEGLHAQLEPIWGGSTRSIAWPIWTRTGRL
jgi:SAM-dependent methyltransferase